MTLRVTNNSTRPLILAPITPETSFMRIIIYNNTHRYMSDSSLFFTYPDGVVIAGHFEVVNGDQISWILTPYQSVDLQILGCIDEDFIPNLKRIEVLILKSEVGVSFKDH